MRHISLVLVTLFFSFALSAQIIPNDDDIIIIDNFPTTSYSFIPGPGKYVVSGWVKEDVVEAPATYQNSSIEISSVVNVIEEFVPYGAIIDGWQQIQGVFRIPENATFFTITLKATNFNIDSYFDDIRVVPFDGNMKSFVYDPVTQRLMAELDENNYATFYEYDSEGGLVRVKKETENGIYTIQETRSKTVIQN